MFIDFYDLTAWDGCWFVVYIRRFIYKLLNVCPFDLKAVAGESEGWARKPVNHTSWTAVVTQIDRPKSVCNRCVIELFVALFMLSLCPFDISAGAGVFVIWLSQISSFFRWCSECVPIIILHIFTKSKVSLIKRHKDVLSEIKYNQKVAGRLAFDLLTQKSLCGSFPVYLLNMK